MGACTDCVTLWELVGAIGIGVVGGGSLVLLADWWWWKQRDAMIMELQRHWARRNERNKIKKWQKNEENALQQVEKSDR